MLTCRLSEPRPELRDPVPVHRVLAEGDKRATRLRRVAEFRHHFREHGSHYDLLHTMLSGWELLLNLGYLRRLGMPVILEMVLLGADDPVSVSRMALGSLKLRLLRQVDVRVGISRAFLPALLATGIPEERFHLIYTGVDLDRYRPRVPDERRQLRSSLGISDEARVVVSVGSVIERKGMDRVLAAWESTQPTRGRDLLLIVGPDRLENGLRPGDVDYCESLRRRAETGSLGGTVRFAGRVDNVDEYLGASDLFLFLSRREGLGTVILEALATGLPCIVSPLDGIGEELITEGKTGYVAARPDDNPAVAAVVRHMLDAPDARSALGAAGREVARALLTREARRVVRRTLSRDVGA